MLQYRDFFFFFARRGGDLKIRQLLIFLIYNRSQVNEIRVKFDGIKAVINGSNSIFLPTAGRSVTIYQRVHSSTKMLRLSLVLVLSAVCLSQGYQGYKNVRTADMDFLHKQKKLFELMFYVDQQALTDAEYFEIGRNYDIGSNMEYYTDKVNYNNFFSSKIYIH